MKTDIISQQAVCAFKQVIWDYYAANRREFPWRYVEDPYHIVVSEIMLQQTQTFRVEPKFKQFIERISNMGISAHAIWPDVLLAWQGLGYNSRAKRLHEISKRIFQNLMAKYPMRQIFCHISWYWAEHCSINLCFCI